MKTKVNFEKQKLSLKKSTITVLNREQQAKVKGGNGGVVIGGVKIPTVRAN